MAQAQPADTWQDVPVGTDAPPRAADDGWQDVPAAVPEPAMGQYGISDRLSKGFMPANLTSYVLRKLPDIAGDTAEFFHQGVSQAADAIMGNGPSQFDDIRPEVEKQLIGIGRTPEAAKQETDALMRSWRRQERMGGAIMGPMTALTAPLLGAYRSLISRPLEEIGGPPKEVTEMAGMVAGAVAGMPAMGREMARVRVSPDGKVSAQRIGELPKGEDFKTAADLVVDEVKPAVDSTAERVLNPVVIGKDGQIFRARTHLSAENLASEKYGVPSAALSDLLTDFDGFITTKGRLVSREEAMKIADTAQQETQYREEGETRLRGEQLIDNRPYVVIEAERKQALAAAEQNLRTLWDERGIHPAEALHDAQSDAFLKHELTRPPIEAFHGSQHSFDFFDISKIDTGEGAQVYGHGFYFAENPEVATSYRTAGLGRGLHRGLIDGKPYDANNPEHVAALYRDKFGGGAASQLQIDIDVGPMPKGRKPIVEEAIWLLNSDADIPQFSYHEGNLYRVRIHAHQDHMIDFGKSLDEQSPFVLQAFERLRDAIKAENPMAQSGLMLDSLLGDKNKALQKVLDAAKEMGAEAPEKSSLSFDDFYRQFAKYDFDQISAAEMMSNAGISGIKYFDQGSRLKGEGTKNYVIFKGEDVQITHRNGEPFFDQRFKQAVDARDARIIQGLEEPPSFEPPPAPHPDRPLGEALRAADELRAANRDLPTQDRAILGELISAVRSAAAKRQLSVEDGVVQQGDRFKKAPLSETAPAADAIAEHAWVGADQDLARAQAAMARIEEVKARHPELAPSIDRAVQAVDDTLAQRDAMRPKSLGAAASDPPLTPLTEQPSPPAGALMASAQEGIKTLFDIGRDIQMKVAPMATGTRDSILAAKDFANTMRKNRWEWSRIHDYLTKTFEPEQWKRMWDAADEESVLRQEGFKREPVNADVEDRGGGSFFVRSRGDTSDMLSMNETPTAFKVGIATVGKKTRGTGVGVALYEKAVEFAAEKGLPVRSDMSVSAEAIRVYDALKRRGYSVTEAPDTVTTAAGKTNSSKGYVFEVRDIKSGSADYMGLATLEPAERAIVDGLHARAENAWLRARDIGLVEGEGLPAYTPRMVINAAGAIAEQGSLPLNSIGTNLKASTARLMKRKYLTAEETEAAAKAKYGEEAELARDIRTLPLAIAQLEDAIAGRTLVNEIKKAGKAGGSETVAEGAAPAGSDQKWFTIDHPALKTWRPKFEEVDGKVQVLTDKDGNTIFEQVPIYIRGDFEGPLRAVLDTKSGAAYQAMMSLKSKTMSVIMYSPAIHNLVEFGRAFPAMPTRIFKAYFDGNRAKNDVAIMTEAIDSGLVPIGKRFFNQDIDAIMESPDLTPGRSWTAKVLAAVPGLFDEGAGTAVKRAVDKAGDFWHNTLLWDRIGDLQMGLYTNLRGDLIGKGVDPKTASITAAHWANRYAGALPQEAMSSAARKSANMLLFSRSFTMGNLGVMKDMVTGLPKDALAMIEREGGFKPGSLSSAEDIPQVGDFTKGMARRKAMMVVALDIALMYVGNSVLQSSLDVMLGDKTIDEEAHGYTRRFKETLNDINTHPLSLLQPFSLAERLSATGENEPGRRDRIRIGYQSDGTAIYARNPVGKIGEEFIGYMSNPLEMLRKKEGTVARPLLQIFSNDKGFGRKVYDPNAETPMDKAAAIWAMVEHFAKAQTPEGQINALSDLVKGEGDPKTNTLQAGMPFLGVTISKGAPGGPASGELYDYRQRHDVKVNMALPDIRKQILRGDVGGALQRMRELDIPPGLQRFYVRTTLDPSTRVGGRTLRDFYMGATPEQRDRLERARQ